jgi:hypothetical protein
MKRKYIKPRIISEEFVVSVSAQGDECCCNCGSPAEAQTIFAGNFSTSYCT